MGPRWRARCRKSFGLHPSDFFFFSYAANNTDTTGFGVIVAIKVMIILIYN